MILFSIIRYLILLNLLSIKTNNAKRCNESFTKKPIISALIDVHSGENCEIINYYGIQQIAILESTMKQINLELNPFGIELVLQIFDTCSTKEGAQLATLKALVSSRQTCMKTPLLLGFLGPETDYSLYSVKNVTTYFKIPHLVPFSQDQKYKRNTFHIAKYPTYQHSKALKLLLDMMGLKRIVLLVEDNNLSKIKAESLFNIAETSNCLSNPIIIDKLNLFNIINNLEEDFSAILAITESTEVAEIVLTELKDLNLTIVISIGKAGVITWPESENSVYILQMISSYPIEDLKEAYDPELYKEFSNQISSKCETNETIENRMYSSDKYDYQDWTVNLYQYGLLLYSSNIRAAYFLKCQKEDGIGLCNKLKYIPRTEWNKLLSNSSFFIRPPQSINRNKVITFNMDVNVTFKINYLEDQIKQVGYFQNDELIIENNYKFKKFNNLPYCIPFKTLFITRTIMDNKIPYYNDNSGIYHIINFNNLNYFQLIGLICGIGFGITIILTLIFYNVYKSFKILTNHSSGGGGGSSMSERGSA